MSDFEIRIVSLDPLLLECSACQHRFDCRDCDALQRDIIEHIKKHSES